MEEEQRKESGPTFGVRHVQCLLLFTCLFVMYTILSNIPLAIVAMTDSSKANPDFEEFDWDEETRASILSSFFWGYLASQIPFGALTTRYGCKAILLLGVGTNCILNLIIPICTSLGGSVVLFVLRVLQGIFQGVLFPSTQGLIASWAPKHERSRLSVLIYPGAQIGTIVSLVSGGPLASSALGWPGIFYVWGVVGLIWCAVYWYLGANNPMEHSSICAAERDYIMGSATGHGVKQPTPWGQFLRSRAFYALTSAHVSYSYTFWTITTVMPTYMNGLFGVDIRANALLSAVPPVGLFLMSHIFGQLARFCTSKLNFSIRQLRITFNSIGFLVPAASLVGLGFVSEEYPILAVSLLTISYGVGSAVFMGFHVNHMDLCPSHAAVLMGTTNSFAAGGGVIATLAVGWLVKDETNVGQWQLLFSIGAALLVAGTLIFGFFGRFKDQNWVKDETDKSGEIDNTPTENLDTIKTTVLS